MFHCVKISVIYKIYQRHPNHLNFKPTTCLMENETCIKIMLIITLGDSTRIQAEYTIYKTHFYSFCVAKRQGCHSPVIKDYLEIPLNKTWNWHVFHVIISYLVNFDLKFITLKLCLILRDN